MVLNADRITTTKTGGPLDDLELRIEARRLIREGEARALRLWAEATQAEVAAAVGATPGAVSRWERGTRSPRGAVAARYGALLRHWRLRRLESAGAA